MIFLVFFFSVSFGSFGRMISHFHLSFGAPRTLLAILRTSFFSSFRFISDYVYLLDSDGGVDTLKLSS